MASCDTQTWVHGGHSYIMRNQEVLYYENCEVCGSISALRVTLSTLRIHVYFRGFRGARATLGLTQTMENGRLDRGQTTCKENETRTNHLSGQVATCYVARARREVNPATRDVVVADVRSRSKPKRIKYDTNLREDLASVRLCIFAQVNENTETW